MISHGEFDLMATNFRHPDVTTGQHTNGPATIWVRYQGREWICTGERHMHKVRTALIQQGYEYLRQLKGTA